MTALSDSLLVLASDLLTEFGESVAVERVAEGAYNTATGGVAAGTTTNYTMQVSPLTDLHNNKDNSTVFNGVPTLVAYSATVPLIGDEVTYNSVAYRLISVEATRLSGVSIIYILGLAK